MIVVVRQGVGVSITPITLDSSSLLNYYSSQLQTIAANAQNASTANSQTANSSSNPSTSFGQPVTVSSSGATSSNSSQTPPWDQPAPSTQALDAQVLSTTNFIQPNTTPLVGSSGASKATQ